MINFPLPRIDTNPELQKLLLPYCRLSFGETWNDPKKLHRVGCLDAADNSGITQFMNSKKATLAIQDPPYNFVAFEERDVQKFVEWS